MSRRNVGICLVLVGLVASGCSGGLLKKTARKAAEKDYVGYDQFPAHCAAAADPAGPEGV